MPNLVSFILIYIILTKLIQKPHALGSINCQQNLKMNRGLNTFVEFTQ